MATKTGVVGLEGAIEMSRMLALLESIGGNASFIDTPRNAIGGESRVPSNADIIDYLAEGNSRSASPKRRDIRPSKLEVESIAKTFTADLSHILRISGKMKVKSTPDIINRKAKATIAKALEKAAKSVAKVMYDHVKSGTVQGGGKADAVGDTYATWRQGKFGVSDNAVFIASRQLGEALQKGLVKVQFNNSKLLKFFKKA